MKSLRPQITRNWHATGLLSSRATATCPLHQRVAHNAAYSTQYFQRNPSFLNREFHQDSSPRALVYGRVASPQHARYMRTLPQKLARHATPGRASYSTEAISSNEPTIHDVFESITSTWQYVVADPSTLAAVIIDPVLDYDPVTQVVTTTSADALLSLIKEKGYKIEMILETHPHADHITAASYLQKRLAQEQGHRPLIGIGKRAGQVQKRFAPRYGVPEEECENVFDKLFEDDETFAIGDLKATAIHTPGHTPDHLTYKIGDNVFCGDSIFHDDVGTARCDFPGGNATELYHSARKLLSLPDHIKIWTGHDYPPEGRDAPVPFMSVREHREKNKHLNDSVSEEEFVALREERDASLDAPRLLHQSLQMNIRAGHLPKPNEAGLRLLHLPLNTKGLEF